MVLSNDKNHSVVHVHNGTNYQSSTSQVKVSIDMHLHAMQAYACSIDLLTFEITSEAIYSVVFLINISTVLT